MAFILHSSLLFKKCHIVTLFLLIAEVSLAFLKFCAHGECFTCLALVPALQSDGGPYPPVQTPRPSLLRPPSFGCPSQPLLQPRASRRGMLVLWVPGKSGLRGLLAGLWGVLFSPTSSPSPIHGALTGQGEAQGHMQGAHGILSSASELPFVFALHPRQLQHPRVPGLRGAQGQAPPGPAHTGRGVAVDDDTDQAQGLVLRD